VGTITKTAEQQEAVAPFRRPSRITLDEPADSEVPKDETAPAEGETQADEPSAAPAKDPNRIGVKALVGVGFAGAAGIALVVGGTLSFVEHGHTRVSELAVPHRPNPSQSALSSSTALPQPGHQVPQHNLAVQAQTPPADPPPVATAAPQLPAGNALTSPPPSVQPPREPLAAVPALAARTAPEIMRQERKIVASPMMLPEQVKVLDLITATNAISIQADRKVVQAMAEIADLKKAIADLQQRQSLNEAAASVVAASQTDSAAPAQPPRVKGAAEPKEDCMGRPQYVIASVSPRYVTLRGGNEPPLIDQTVGSVIPCYGKIHEIKQEGARWVVKTDHDVIGSR
jgi:hypothetical protein